MPEASARSILNLPAVSFLLKLDPPLEAERTDKHERLDPQGVALSLAISRSSSVYKLMPNHSLPDPSLRSRPVMVVENLYILGGEQSAAKTIDTNLTPTQANNGEHRR